jgi:hypothetical protein
MAEDDVDPRSLRVSDRERDHAVGRLKDAVSEGLIDIDEFDERTSHALVARTRGELDAVTSDLPAGPAARQGTDDIVELKGSMSSVERRATGRSHVSWCSGGGWARSSLISRRPGSSTRWSRSSSTSMAVRWKYACRKGRVLRWTE